MKLSKKILCWLLVSVCVLLFYPADSLTQMIANIDQDVQTDFGVYHPYPVQFTPQVPSFTLNADFSNVKNFDMFASNFNAVDLEFLYQNHFVVKKSGYKQLYDIYNHSTWDGTPIIVTSDAVLHIYHVLFDYFLSQLEQQILLVDLNQLTDGLIAETETIYNQTAQPKVKEAAYFNLAYLCVAKKLLNGAEAIVPDTVSNLVDQELALIEKHDGFEFSPVMGQFSKLDYSQLQPRGHYTRNDTLKAYFKAMMWYGWTIFTMEPNKFSDLAPRHSLQALLFTQLIYSKFAQNRSLSERWDEIYEPSVFFVGKTDDPNIKQYRAIAEQLYGSNFLSLPADSLANETLLNQFMFEAQALPDPKIPNWIYGTSITYKGFRFMGQRFIPDSYMLSHLVDPYVSYRFFPKGLDVMAILGSDRAYALLDSIYAETSFGGYAEQIAEFKNEFSSLADEKWAQNLYWNWLYCLMPLLYKKGAGYPNFMQTTAWADKELLAALASWAELRHDTILYAKQSMTPCCMPPDPLKNYVEPNPYLYGRLASLVRFTRVGLESRNMLLSGFDEKIELFEQLLHFLKKISIKELENIPLSNDESDNIYCFGRVMQDLVSVFRTTQYPYNYQADDMAIVADVHTDSNSDLCLEEGVGFPLEIFVIVNEGNNIRMTQGAIFSYYEFKQPIADRLTDEAWRVLLIGENRPEMPEWISSFMNPAEDNIPIENFSPDNLFYKMFTVIEDQSHDDVSVDYRLGQNYPNPFNPETVIEFDLPENSAVSLKIYNLLGQKIRTLFSGHMLSGMKKMTWDGKNDAGRLMPSGIYFYKLTAEKYSQNKRMLLIR